LLNKFVEDGELEVQRVSGIDLELFLAKRAFCERVSDQVIVTVRVPVHVVSVNDSRSLDGGVDVKLSVELTSFVFEVLNQWSTLSGLEVGSGKCLDFPLLKSAIHIPESLRTSASGSGQIIIVLVLPVGPADQVMVSDLGNLGDLLGARTLR